MVCVLRFLGMVRNDTTESIRLLSSVNSSSVRWTASLR